MRSRSLTLDADDMAQRLDAPNTGNLVRMPQVLNLFGADRPVLRDDDLHARLPYSPEFRRPMAELVRAGRDPDDLAGEFEPTAQSGPIGACATRPDQAVGLRAPARMG
jgi:transposase